MTLLHSLISRMSFFVAVFWKDFLHIQSCHLQTRTDLFLPSQSVYLYFLLLSSYTSKDFQMKFKRSCKDVLSFQFLTTKNDVSCRFLIDFLYHVEGVPLFLCMLSRSVTSTSLQPHGLYPPDSSVHGIFQARLLEWVAISSPRRSSRSRDQTHISCLSCTGRWVLYHCAT